MLRQLLIIKYKNVKVSSVIINSKTPIIFLQYFYQSKKNLIKNKMLKIILKLARFLKI